MAKYCHVGGLLRADIRCEHLLRHSMHQRRFKQGKDTFGKVCIEYIFVLYYDKLYVAMLRVDIIPSVLYVVVSPLCSRHDLNILGRLPPL